MPILFVSIALGWLASLCFTQTLFRTSWEWEREQIAVDNAGILWGQNDDKVFQALKSLNEQMSALEIPHHVAHFCARSALPQTAAACLPTDQSLEREIETLRQTGFQWASGQWQANEHLVRAEKRRLQSQLFTLKRFSQLPVVAVVCKLCGQPVQWELHSQFSRVYQVISHKFAREAEVYVEFRSARLNRESRQGYSLKAVPP